MSNLKIYDVDGTAIGDMDIADDLLVLDKGEQAVHDVVVAQLAGRRAGTASTLRKGEVAGSNKKPWRQKGTGRARAGYRQSPVWRGGSVAFGPHPRSYTCKVNKKVSKLAFKRTLSEKIVSGEVKILESISLLEGKTKLFLSLMKSIGVSGKVLFIFDKIEKNVVRASRNISGVEITTAKDANVYQLLRYSSIVINKGGIEGLMLRMGENKGKKVFSDNAEEESK